LPDSSTAMERVPDAGQQASQADGRVDHQDAEGDRPEDFPAEVEYPSRGKGEGGAVYQGLESLVRAGNGPGREGGGFARAGIGGRTSDEAGLQALRQSPL